MFDYDIPGNKVSFDMMQTISNSGYPTKKKPRCLDIGADIQIDYGMLCKMEEDLFL
ncbi:hypothetical protein [Eubacterium barkeri]|uniref:hypothetical protein n=1 Tax=Eubacterium barkeri TaxID=1528 RepID=UPI0015A3F9EC|nr:hypothetical protein [Eubacterium barkeri]